MRSLNEGYQALVLGSSGAIGSALMQTLRMDPRCASVQGLSRRIDPRFDLTDEVNLAQALAALAPMAPFDLIVDATGALTIDGQGPEKRLAAVSANALLRQLAVNAVGPAVVMRHAMPWLAKGRRVIYAKLSARVGSIEDNHKGGWYGYRAAKAALNQLLQTAAIECARTRPLAVVAALQPGTVASGLSQAFVPAAEALSPAVSAAGLLRALDALPASARAHFVDYQGQPVPW